VLFGGGIRRDIEEMVKALALLLSNSQFGTARCHLVEDEQYCSVLSVMKVTLSIRMFGERF
jgi:hypothetical protein